MHLEEKTSIPLSALYIGELAEIVFIDSSSQIGKKIKEMGLRENKIIELISYDSTISKKIIIKVEETLLSFESTISEYIRVRPIRPWYNFYKEQALFDSLTGCLNRNSAHFMLHEEYNKALNNKMPFSLILIDIDDFKKINDRYGHLHGDKVLQKLGAALRETIRRIDLVFRWGGEEFLVLLKGLTIGDSYKIADRLRQHIQSLNILPEKEVVTISAGVDGLPPPIYLEHLIKRTDKALYVAKARGKNQVYTLFDKECEIL